ncbi:Probable small nuclear ribonucleoprotein G [Eumeta japonica]|uniref:Small nuclear ribonucleoprotein G n=1 Tax=Eumeta variegata TaxID=151549 RepID=A0A4C1SRE8_EUMVA|nr:Probable small nuclear ribonucleoprotein G [Eumeta japonica]
MSKAHPPELKKFMDKKLSIKLNGGRSVTGVLRGFDPFMNLVVDESVEECKDGQRNNIGMVTPTHPSVTCLHEMNHQNLGI